MKINNVNQQSNMQFKARLSVTDFGARKTMNDVFSDFSEHVLKPTNCYDQWETSPKNLYKMLKMQFQQATKSLNGTFYFLEEKLINNASIFRVAYSDGTKNLNTNLERKVRIFPKEILPSINSTGTISFERISNEILSQTSFILKQNPKTVELGDKMEKLIKN